MLRCFICKKTVKPRSRSLDSLESGENIFTFETSTSNTPIYRFLESFIGQEIDKDENPEAVGCKSCLYKLNEYDEAFCIAQKIQNEFIEFLSHYLNEYKDEVYIKEVELINTDEDGVTFLMEANSQYQNEDDENIEEDGCHLQTLKIEKAEFEEQVIEHIEELEVDETRSVENVICKKSNKKRDSLKSKKNDKRKVCESCSEYFTTNKELTEHKKKAHFKKYVCDICGACYKVRAIFNTHVAMHRGEIPFKCNTCGKTFTQKGALKRHLPLHTGEKPFQCHKCGKQFIHYSSFRMHNLSHDNIRRKKCEICGLQLLSSSHLSRHMLVHTGQKPHACPKCGQRFAQRYNMTTHMKTNHQGIKRKKKQITDSHSTKTGKTSTENYEIVIQCENE